MPRNIIGKRSNALEENEEGLSDEQLLLELTPHIDPELQGHKRKRVAELEEQLEQARQERETLAQQIRSAIVKRDDGYIVIGGCVGDAAGLEIPADISEADMRVLANALFSIEEGIQLYIGDMLAAADRLEYGFINELADELGKEGKTLSNWKSICKGVKTSLRREVLHLLPESKPLTLKHYSYVQKLEESDQRYWLTQAAANNWSAAQLAEMMKAPSPTRTPLNEFWRQWNRFTKSQMEYWKEAPQHERHQIAETLRKIADELEK